MGYLVTILYGVVTSFAETCKNILVSSILTLQPQGVSVCVCVCVCLRVELHMILYCYRISYPIYTT